MKSFATLLFAVLYALSLPAAEQSKPVYELRTYWAPPGKLDELHARFKNHTLKLFEKHGMTNIGYWVPVSNPENKLIYIISHASQESARKSWAAFVADPDWQRAQKASEEKGKLVQRIDATFLAAADFSPAIAVSSNAAPRLFEMRTYKTPEGQLAPLLARFREHTLKLFNQHGMSNFGYWIPTDQAKGADNTLIYLLAHKDQAAADASWKAFRADPDWVAAKKASETKGSLTRQVVWAWLKPTDYSPTR
jgi:hypothetical protein